MTTETIENTEYHLVTRVEIIDHDPSLGDNVGLVWWKHTAKDVMISIQDEGRTLKVFVR